EQIKEILRILAEDRREDLGGMAVARREFYATGEQLVNGEMQPLDFPQVDMLGITFADGSFIKVRPSGTEPKIRFYFCIAGADEAEAEDNLKAVQQQFFKSVSKYIKKY
ncbi:MAG: phospho-sugar mutase, partial [Firmicutes bacterium]|nr:phospho-sugar mutase [Bacillota bacterium]